jgi:hypothetical protein
MGIKYSCVFADPEENEPDFEEDLGMLDGFIRKAESRRKDRSYCI